MAEFLFYFLSVVAAVSGLRVVTAKSPMTSIIALLTCFLSLAVIYLLAGFQFIAAVQVMVYVGAIMVLFLYVIMLLNLGSVGQAAEADLGFLRGGWMRAGATLAATIVVVGLLAVQRGAPAGPAGGTATFDSDPLEGLALGLFGRHFLSFEATGMLLLATMVAVIALAKRRRGGDAGGRP